MIQSFIRPELLKLKPYTSARHLYQEGTMLDANENAFGSVIKSPFGLTLNRYPDPFSKKLKKALAKYTQLSEEHIFVGVGSDEAIDLLIRLFAAPRQEVITFEPTYGMYRVAAEIQGAAVKACPLDEDFQIDVNRFQKMVSAKTKIAFCCSPNNPTGNLLEENDLVKLCKNFKGMVVLDEAYIEFASRPSLARLIPNFHNLVVLRTFSKAWGLAGLRVGYALAHPEVIQFLNKIKPPYNLNSVSAYLAQQALKRKKQMTAWRNKMIQEREQLNRTFEEMGCEVFPSEANFLLIRIRNASKIAKTIAQEHRMIIRDFSSRPKLHDCLRITVGAPEQNKHLVKILRGLL